jgi:gas vesicle protein
MSSVLRYAGVALAGGLLGAIAGVLLAPDSGRVTRRRLAFQLEEGRDALARQGRRLGRPRNGMRTLPTDLAA